LVTYAAEYRSVNHKNLNTADLGSFFGHSGFKRATFPNAQTFDLAGLQGRLLSSSYAPESGHPNHLPMLEALHAIFLQHQSNGHVILECDTAVYYGQLTT